MFRIALLLSSLFGVWQMTGPSIDPWGGPKGSNADSGPDIDPWG